MVKAEPVDVDPFAAAMTAQSTRFAIVKKKTDFVESCLHGKRKARRANGGMYSKSGFTSKKFKYKSKSKKEKKAPVKLRARREVPGDTKL